MPHVSNHNGSTYFDIDTIVTTRCSRQVVVQGGGGVECPAATMGLTPTELRGEIKHKDAKKTELVSRDLYNQYANDTYSASINTCIRSISLPPARRSLQTPSVTKVTDTSYAT